MISKFLNWILIASCAFFLSAGIYSSRLTKASAITAIAVFIVIRLNDTKKLFFKKFLETTTLNKAIYSFLFISILSKLFGISA